jgi:ribonuclease BN (tRNA processing enzyme)
VADTVRVRFLGTGDPFGTGGRFQSCILLEGPNGRFLLDCGATTSLALARAGIDPTTIDGIVVTHWHPDHFGGLLNLALDALIRARDGATQARRQRPLWIAGPVGTDARLRAALELFGWMPPPTADGSDPLAAVVEHIPLIPGQPTRRGPLEIRARSAVHTPEALCIRVEMDGRAIAYSGDTAWTDALIELADQADLLICQTYTFELEHPIMLSYRRLARERHRLTCRRLILTHVGAELESRLSDVSEQVAEDGLEVTL